MPHTIRALPEPLPAPGRRASREVMMALTARAGTFHPGIAPGSQTGRPPARTALRPTTWGGPPAYGSPPCPAPACWRHPDAPPRLGNAPERLIWTRRLPDTALNERRVIDRNLRVGEPVL